MTPIAFVSALVPLFLCFLTTNNVVYSLVLPKWTVLSDTHSRSRALRIPCPVGESRCDHYTEPKELNVESPYYETIGTEQTEVPLTTQSPVKESSVTKERSPSCMADKSGFFGSGSSVITVLDFWYEIEYNHKLTDIDRDTLSVIERAVIDSLLPGIFVDECRVRTRARWLGQGNQRKLGIVGVHARPEDAVLVGASCKRDFSTQLNSCVVVRGKIHIFITLDESEAGRDGRNTLTDIENHMNRGDFDGIQNGIVHIKYINGTLTNGSIAPGPPDQPRQFNNRLGGKFPVYGLIIIVMVPLVAVVFVAVHQATKNKDTPIEEEECLSSRF